MTTKCSGLTTTMAADAHCDGVRPDRADGRDIYQNMVDRFGIPAIASSTTSILLIINPRAKQESGIARRMKYNGKARLPSQTSNDRHNPLILRRVAPVDEGIPRRRTQPRRPVISSGWKDCAVSRRRSRHTQIGWKCVVPSPRPDHFSGKAPCGCGARGGESLLRWSGGKQGGCNVC